MDENLNLLHIVDGLGMGVKSSPQIRFVAPTLFMFKLRKYNIRYLFL